MERKHTRQGYVDALLEMAPSRRDLVVLDADVARATRTCDFAERYPERFFNCGAQEQNLISVAAGLALENMLPFASTFAMFAACRAADQVRNSVAYPDLNVKIGATHGGISTGGDGASHQCNEDIAIMRSFPNMTVLVPGDYEEAKQATKAAAAWRGPVYLRFGRDVYPVVPELQGDFRIGRGKLLRSGSDLTLVSTGIMASEVLAAAAELKKQGVSARVIHLPSVKPLDEEILLQASRETNGFVTAEEHSILGGLGEAVAGCIAQECPALVRRVGVRDVYGESGTADELLTRYGLRAADIVREAALLLEARAAVPT